MRHIPVKSSTIFIVGSLAVLLAVKAFGANYQEKNSPTLQQLGEKAVLIIKQQRTASLNGYVLVVCKASLWKTLEQDSDLGPFLKYKKAANNLDAIVALPETPKSGSTYGVYFQDNRPIGFVEVKTAQGEKISVETLAKAYVSVTEDSDRGAANSIRFEEVETYSDDNKPIPTLKVVSDSLEDYRSGAIKSASGYLLVWNQPNNYYILEIKGKDVRQTSTERKFFSVDGMFLQIVEASVADVLPSAKRAELDDKAILNAHRDWEAKFMEDAYKAKLQVESTWRKLSNGKDALLWQASVPESAKSNVSKQVYLTVVTGDYVLVLGSAVTDTTGENAAQQLLLNTMETLKTSDKPTDLRKLRATILKEAARI